MATESRFILGAELRAEKIGSEMKIVARAVKYNARSKKNVPAAGCYERCAPGCFTRSLKSGEDVKALLNHDQNFILGRTSNGSLTLHDSKDALRFEVRLNPAVQFHRDVHSLIQDGTLNECSFAFSVEPGGDEWTEEKDEGGMKCGVRTIRNAALWDCSIVTTAAYGAGATSAEARSLAYDFKKWTSAKTSEDLEILARAGNVAKLVAEDRANTLEDAQNILRATKLGDELRAESFREKLARVREELGLLGLDD